MSYASLILYNHNGLFSIYLISFMFFSYLKPVNVEDEKEEEEEEKDGTDPDDMNAEPELF